jgi:hypothetical protein
MKGPVSMEPPDRPFRSGIDPRPRLKRPDGLVGRGGLRLGWMCTRGCECGQSLARPLLLDALGWVFYRAGDVHCACELLESAGRCASEESTLHCRVEAVCAGKKTDTLAKR